MTKNELNDAYFNWMYQLVFDGRYSKKLSYQKLLRELHRIEFTYSISDGWKSGGRWSGFKVSVWL